MWKPEKHDLANAYSLSGKKQDAAISKMLSQAGIKLPPEVKAKLYDRITKG